MKTSPQCQTSAEFSAYLGENVDLEQAAYQAVIERTKKQEPDPQLFEYVGRTEFEPPQKVQSRIEAAERGIANAIDTEKSELCVSETDLDPNLDSATLVSADGRVFRQKPGAWLNCHAGLERGFTHLAGAAQTRDIDNELRESLVDVHQEDSTSSQAVTVGDQFASDADVDVIPIITGSSDGRSLITSSAYPWRAVGVGLFGPSSSSISASGFMVGPRHVLTVAHAISGNGSPSSLNPVVAAPAARGSGFNGDRWPFGRRYVQWYYWPNGWNGSYTLTRIRYDYALLILEDINWSPGWIRFGYQSTTWLDFKNFNTAGYPGNQYQCSASLLGSGQCGGYMYRQYEKVRAVLPGYFYHKFDISKGQSGSPIYWYNGTTRIAYGIQSGEGSISNIACRIRSGNFDSICSWISNWPSSFFSNVTC